MKIRKLKVKIKVNYVVLKSGYREKVADKLGNRVFVF